MTNSKTSTVGKTMARPRVVIVGAGVSGLAIAWELAMAGAAVTVFDKARAGRAASHAAAGMLAGGVETEPGEEALYRLNRLSQELWPDYRDALEAASGVDIGYRDEGTIVAAITRDDLEQVRFNYDFQRSLGIPLAWLSGAQLREKEPYLRAGVAGGVYSPADHQVDNRRLAEALKIAATGAGVTLREETPVDRVIVEGGRVRGVSVGGQRVEADVVVLAAGAEAREIAGLPEALLPPVRPVKGQMLALRMDPEAPLLRHVLWAPKIYLVPRKDGRLLIGATVEEKGFNDDLTAGGLLALLEAAWRAVPGIEELPLQESWVGFRPTSRDDAPILGPTEIEGLHLATGHHRNGILLAPVTGKLGAEAILNDTLPEAIAGFTLDRFQRSRAAE